MVVVCLVSYLGTFFFLEKRADRSWQMADGGKTTGDAQLPDSNYQLLTPKSKPASSSCQNAISYLLTPISSPVFWLLAFVTLVLIRYAFDYPGAARSLQVVVLLTGIVIGKGIAFYANRVLAMGDKREEVGSGSGPVLK
jgi:hypothetical protein